MKLYFDCLILYCVVFQDSTTALTTPSNSITTQQFIVQEAPATNQFVSAYQPQIITAKVSILSNSTANQNTFTTVLSPTRINFTFSSSSGENISNTLSIGEINSATSNFIYTCATLNSTQEVHTTVTNQTDGLSSIDNSMTTVLLSTLNVSTAFQNSSVTATSQTTSIQLLTISSNENFSDNTIEENFNTTVEKLNSTASFNATTFSIIQTITSNLSVSTIQTVINSHATSNANSNQQQPTTMTATEIDSGFQTKSTRATFIPQSITKLADIRSHLTSNAISKQPTTRTTVTKINSGFQTKSTRATFIPQSITNLADIRSHLTSNAISKQPTTRTTVTEIDSDFLTRFIPQSSSILTGTRLPSSTECNKTTKETTRINFSSIPIQPISGQWTVKAAIALSFGIAITVFALITSVCVFCCLLAGKRRRKKKKRDIQN